MMLVYLWSRRNPDVRVSFFGILVFNAPYLPWVLFVFSFLFGSPLSIDILGLFYSNLSLLFNNYILISKTSY